MNEDTLDRQLEQRALKEGWDIPAGKRAEVIRKTIERATCGDFEIEEAATRTLIMADALAIKRQQAEQRRLEAEHARKLQLIELAVKLGIVGNDDGGNRSQDSGPSTRAIG